LVASTISKSVGGWATLKAAEQHFWIERNNEILDVKNNIEAEIQEMIGKIFFIKNILNFLNIMLNIKHYRLNIFFP
jgi:hypothetical protein